MTGFATTSGVLFQQSEEERRVDDLIKRIGYAQQAMQVQLGIWQRAYQIAPKQAAEAKARLIESYREQGQLFQTILKIDDQRQRRIESRDGIKEYLR